MRTLANNKMKLKGVQGMLPPLQQSRLERIKRESDRWIPHWSGDEQGNRFEVQGTEHAISSKVDVNLEQQTCTCRAWQLSGMPCKHAIAAISYKGSKPEDYCHAWLTMGAYRTTYEYFVQPTLSQQYWQQTDYIRPVPPPKRKKKAGRPKKARRRDSSEEPVAESRRVRVRRAYGATSCSWCGCTDHNILRCQNPGVPNRPRRRRAEPENNQHQSEQQTEINVSQSAPTEDVQQSQPHAQSWMASNARGPMFPMSMSGPGQSSNARLPMGNLNAPGQGGYRPPPLRPRMLSPPRHSAIRGRSAIHGRSTPPPDQTQYQVRSSPSASPITHDFHGGPIRLMPTPQMQPTTPMQPRPPQNPQNQ